jgi:dTDP-4-dehydrorhamnose 3,5-epimerase
MVSHAHGLVGADPAAGREGELTVATAARLVAAPASTIRIAGAEPLVRTLHQDPRGFLLETLRRDDASVRGDRFAMSYTSVTVPGEFRDRDRWHVHKVQTDRFVVPLGEMILALYDGRPGSSTHGRLEVVRMVGASLDDPGAPVKRDTTTELVPIPPGVYHCIGNLSDRPFVLVNFPTELYNADDEGRVPFDSLTVPAIGRPFRWEEVVRGPAEVRR